MLDVACGRGRHALATAGLGLSCLAVDRDRDALRTLAAAAPARVCAVRADLEEGPGVPWREVAFGAVLVFRYLWRPRAAALARALRPGGLLVYETFTEAQRALPHGPRNPDFLLRPGELPSLFPGLVVLEHWEGRVDAPQPAALARLLAQAPAPSRRDSAQAACSASNGSAPSA